MWFDLFDLRHWRVWVLSCCILAIMLTPTDAVSMFAAAGLVCAFYLVGAWWGHRPSKHSH